MLPISNSKIFCNLLIYIIFSFISALFRSSCHPHYTFWQILNGLGLGNINLNSTTYDYLSRRQVYGFVIAFPFTRHAATTCYYSYPFSYVGSAI